MYVNFRVAREEGSLKDSIANFFHSLLIKVTNLNLYHLVMWGGGCISQPKTYEQVNKPCLKKRKSQVFYQC